jgi:hypothetical protein
VREYMGRGIPFVLAAEDLAVDYNLGFYHKTTNNDDPVNINEIIKFARETEKDKAFPSKLREYALEHMTWDKQFEKVFKLF